MPTQRALNTSICQITALFQDRHGNFLGEIGIER